jgi:hypothetical protein
MFQDVTQKSQPVTDSVVSTDKAGNIVIRIQAKPGAKQNAVTGTSLWNKSVHATETVFLKCIPAL